MAKKSISKKAQLDLFVTHEPFCFRSYGRIVNDEIWPELTVHQKINLRAHAGGDLSGTAPNYKYLTMAFNNGLDTTPHQLYSVDYGLFYSRQLTKKLQNK